MRVSSLTFCLNCRGHPSVHPTNNSARTWKAKCSRRVHAGDLVCRVPRPSFVARSRFGAAVGHQRPCVGHDLLPSRHDFGQGRAGRAVRESDCPDPVLAKFICVRWGPAGISGYATGIPNSPTATQNIYDLFVSSGVNYIGALQSLDTSCFPGCSQLPGQSAPTAYNYFDPQFSSLYSWRSPVGSRNPTGRSEYQSTRIHLKSVLEIR
jgi:hypothetical protein